MQFKVGHNKRAVKAKLIEVFSKQGSNGPFIMWKFQELDGKKEFLGFSAPEIFFGNKTHQWFSVLVGYFLPPSYTLDLTSAIGKQCYICHDDKDIVRVLIPSATNTNSTAVDPVQAGLQEELDETNPDLFT